MNRIPALGDCARRHVDRVIESFPGFFGAPGKKVASGLHDNQGTLKTLQQRVVQLASDAGALADALFQARVEFLLDLIEAVAVQRPEQCEKGGDARRAKPPCAPIRRKDL